MHWATGGVPLAQPDQTAKKPRARGFSGNADMECLLARTVALVGYHPTCNRGTHMKKLVLGALALGLAAVVALPWIRNQEQGPLDDAARAHAPGQFVRLSHGQVHYVVSGPADGAPVVLVHGFSVPGYVFDTMREDLARQGFRVYVPDLYGRGWSDRPDVTYDRDLHAGQIVDFMDALRIARADVIGLSMGGAVSAHLAAQHPGRVRRLVLMAPVTRGNDISVLAWPVAGEWLMRAWFVPKLAGEQLGDFRHPGQHADWPAKFQPQLRYDGISRALLSSLRNTVSKSSLADFQAVGHQDRPVLVVWGRDDKTIPFAQSQDVRAAIPQASFLPLADTGHMPHIEHADEVDAAVAAFLVAADAAAPGATTTTAP